ncbi:MAG: tRNA (adenosine(37)-N6)-dimethylallyltransferase MiaA [Patescibacteria group bacterium]
MNNKLIVILGPTASGKSLLAVKLALFFEKKFGQKFEIISADSRQVYKGMDIGTDKVPKDKNSKEYLYYGIPHHLLDVVSPKRRFTVAHYQKLASKKINEILKKDKIPLIVGGSGFYIYALIDGLVIPHVKPNWQLRKKLEKKSVNELYKMLKKLDPQRAKNIERKNPRRLIRALEIVLTTKKPVPPLKKNPLPYQILIIGIKKTKKELKKLIKKRLIKRLKRGLIEEVKKLKKSGLSWKRLEEFGLDYRWVAFYLQKKITYQEMVDQLLRAIEQFSRRQMSWFKRDKRIKWIKNYQEAKKLINDFLKNKK